MTQSFENKKELRFVITLGNGTFAGSSNNQITLEGFRAVVDIDKAGGSQMGTLRAQIFGVSQSNMNSCVTFPFQPQKLAQGTQIKMNTVQVYAIDGAAETLIFNGNIVNAWGNYQNMPDVFLSIQAQSSLIAALTPTTPLSFKGSIDTATIMSQIAGNMGLTFENNGVNAQLTNQYLAGTSLDQAKSLAKAAGIDMYIDNGVLAIAPANQPRSKPIPLISPDTGLIGFPTFDSLGVNFQMLFNPAVIFGGAFQLQTSIPQAAGIWVARNVAYRLESEKQGGAWFATVRGTKGGLVVTK